MQTNRIKWDPNMTERCLSVYRTATGAIDRANVAANIAKYTDVAKVKTPAIAESVFMEANDTEWNAFTKAINKALKAK